MRSLVWLFIVLIHFISCINCETVTVTVGERGLNFSPQNLTAKVGDVIKFTFFNGKHQIVQSDGPAGSCIKSSSLSSFASPLQEGGEYSYIIPKSLKVDTLFFFCAYSSHCNYGMWGTIKIDETAPPNTLDPPDSPSGTTAPVNESGTNEDNLPIIIGSAIGGFFTLSILGLIVFMLYRRKKYQKQFEISMQPYDPKFGGDGGDGRGGRGGGGDNDLSHVRGSTGMASVSTLENTTLTRSNTYNRNEPNHEVIIQNNQNQPYEQTIRSYDDRTSMEYGSAASINRSSKRESNYKPYTSDFNNGEGSRSGPLSPPPQYDGDIYQQQQPPIPPRPTNIAPTQFGAPYVPPRPIVVSRYPPQQQYGPSISTYQEPQYSTSPDTYGPANPGQNYPQNVPRQFIPPLPTPPPNQPLPPVPSQQLQPIPPPPSQQQTGHYFE